MRRASTAAACLLAACGGGSGGTDAAPQADAHRPHDAGGGGDAIQPLSWVDYSITGCLPGEEPGAPADAGPEDGADPEPCVGFAPLALQFAPIAPSSIDVYNWSFGDEQGDSRAAPDHTFRAPGRYTVSLGVSGPGGTASVTKVDKVIVDPAPLGFACELDAQCASSECVCDEETGCDAGFAGGVCAAECGEAGACEEGVCADLDPLGAGEEDWTRSLCLVECGGGASCPPGLACRELLADGGSWLKACFPAGVLADLGDSCADQDGALQDALCASGSCLEEGARGLCSAPCTGAEDCPPSATCATFNGGASVCLARCDADTPCDHDPWLACEGAGQGGPKGFSVDESADPSGYCAPRGCEADGDCGPDGACTADGFCGPAE